jgi:hypothetical protein
MLRSTKRAQSYKPFGPRDRFFLTETEPSALIIGICDDVEVIYHRGWQLA